MTSFCKAVKSLHIYTKAVDISIAVSPAEGRAWLHITEGVGEGDIKAPCRLDRCHHLLWGRKPH